MKKLRILRMLLAGSIALGIVDSAISEKARAPKESATPASPNTAGPEFKPGLDDLMTMLVQPRHIKLYYAGTQKNWELAAAESRDLRSAFARIAQAIPKYLGLGVEETLNSIIVPRLQALDAAIAAAEPKQFARAYEEMTAACNACHAYMEHPFHVIAVPTSVASSVYPDQDFSARP